VALLGGGLQIPFLQAFEEAAGIAGQPTDQGTTVSTFRTPAYVQNDN
jgi:hypothetical protein